TRPSGTARNDPSAALPPGSGAACRWTCRRFPRPPWPFGHCSTAQPNTTCSNRCTEETHERFDRAGAAGDGTHRGLRMRIERTPSSADDSASSSGEATTVDVMARVLVTVGKTTLHELRRRGYLTVNTDYDGWELPDRTWDE